jgi:DNA helicase-2/ATP-dependent DNA helicase PcrA
MSDPFDLSDAEPEPPRGPGASAPLDAPHKAGHDGSGAPAPASAGSSAPATAGSSAPAAPAPGAPGSITARAMATVAAPYLDVLNPEQRTAAEALDGPVLVLAGAGTGKTRVLVTRLAHILATRRAWPSQILAVTFTNKAAREMLERVTGIIGESADGLWLGTFHSICARILRRHAELVGLKPSFTILDTDDQIRLLKQILEADNIDDKKWPPRALLTVIQRWKDRGLTPERVTAAEAGEFAGGRAVELYKAYQARLRTLNACDFGDLLLHCLTLFGQHADVLADYQARFKYMLVDEYQDTNVAQYLWLRLLAQGHGENGGNICCVGDDDQSIYGWRGAEVGNILRFEKDFPGARIIRLERNYRSTPEILAAASGLIAHNAGRLGKTLWTEGDSGEKLRVTGVWDGEAEARAVADEIESLQRNGTALDQVAVLVRAGSQTREFEERFMSQAIPYRVIGGPRFYERAEIRDVIAYLRIIAQPDDDLAFERIVNVPRRGLGGATLQALHAAAREKRTSLTAAAGDMISSGALRPAARSSLAALLESFSRWRAMVEEKTLPELAAVVIDESGYAEMWQNDKSPEAPGRLDNLKELVAALEDFDGLGAFLEHVSLVMDQEAQAGGEMVSVMTLHAAKGLEFDAVFLPGWEEGLFPHQRALDENGAAGLEEERRLAYVGLTRAKTRAYVSFAANRRLYNQWMTAIPSRFIDELPEGQVEVTAAQGLYGSARPGGAGSFSETARAGVYERDHGRRASREIDIPKTLRGARTASARAAGAPEPAASNGIARGQRVFHQKFGYGKVMAVDGDKLEIAFDKAGPKKVMAGFVEPV